MVAPFYIIPVLLSLAGVVIEVTSLNLVSSALSTSSENLGSKSNSNIMISMGESIYSQMTDGLSTENSKSHDDRATEVSNVLQAFAKSSQAPVLSMLKTMNVETESYWISNQIFVKEASPAVIQSLMGVPGIGSVMEEMVIPLPPLFDLEMGKPNGTEWNVQIMEADKVWKETKGKGVLVASIDTGVRHTHLALMDNYVGTDNHGWYDPILFTKEPNDFSGHGTHTTGTIVGKKGIGVAPRAKWMACKACMLHGCMQHALLACGQFILCPSAPNSGKKKCHGTPHIVNNSWGTPGGASWYDDVIKAWLAAGIKPFFAIGNAGPKCETSGSPGDNDYVIAVGSTDKKDRLSKFSSRGPKVKYEELTDKDKMAQPESLGFLAGLLNTRKKKIVTKTIKPDICAPGENINSAHIFSDNSYKVLSGTSMASPAAAGVAALLLSKNFKMTLEELKIYLYSTTETNIDLTPKGAEQCGQIPETQFPNHMCGYGRINALKAYRRMMKEIDKREKD